MTTEILEDLTVLRSRLPSLSELALSGVSYGSKASDFPIERVVEVTLAPIVKSSESSSGKPSVYRDGSGHELALAEVVEDALANGGVLHFFEKVSFKIKNGTVAGFALYGAHLDAFRYITSQEQLVREFGKPDTVVLNEAYGDLMGYFNLWSDSQKRVAWDEWNKRIYLVSIGME